MSGSGPSFGLKHGSAGIKLSEELDQSGPGAVEKVGGMHRNRPDKVCNDGCILKIW